tara:strand:+ start:23204 stop:23791 length:588 start_codon:yes stop_codon:yes gene_type:complete
MFILATRTQLFFWTLLIFSPAIFSEWKLVNEDSKFHFLSIKASDIAEIHTFRELSGSVKENGEAEIIINIASLETLIPIRNERMNNLLFETEIFPKAIFKFDIDIENTLLIKDGESSDLIFRGELDFKGKKFSIPIHLSVTRLNKSSFLVSSFKPVLLNADRLGLSNGIESLRAIAGLPSISKSVPVTFSLTFRK